MGQTTSPVSPSLFLGIDPGSRHTGYGVIEQRGEKLLAVDYGRISCPAKMALPTRLARLAAGLRELLGRWSPEVAALETPFHGINTRSLVVLAQARGALLSVLAEKEIGIREYSPAEIKMSVTGSGRADKEQVARMVCMLLALRDPDLTDDATDALATAICLAHRDRLDRLTESR